MVHDRPCTHETSKHPEFLPHICLRMVFNQPGSSETCPPPPFFGKVTGKNSSKAFPQEIHFIADITTANDEVSRQKDLILNSNQHQLHCQLKKNSTKSQIIHIFHLNNRWMGVIPTPARPQTLLMVGNIHWPHSARGQKGDQSKISELVHLRFVEMGPALPDLGAMNQAGLPASPENSHSLAVNWALNKCTHVVGCSWAARVQDLGREKSSDWLFFLSKNV